MKGGNGRAPLASILNSQLIAAGAQNSLSGVGGNVIQAVYLKNFDLIAGGNINLTSGVNTVVLDSVGPEYSDPPPRASARPEHDYEHCEYSHRRHRGDARAAKRLGRRTEQLVDLEHFYQRRRRSRPASRRPSRMKGVSATYQVGGNGNQTLTSISGSFTPGTNIVEPLPTGQPPQTPPPAPPGVILKVNRIAGSLTAPINLLTDPKIFGYDPTTGQLIRFDLNLKTDTGAVDPTFAPISVPGDPASVGLNLGSNGSQLDVLISSGTTVYAYNATTGAAVGSFTTSEPVNSIASTDTITVLGSYATNQLQMINLAASLQTGVAQSAPGNPQGFTPASGFTLLGGLSGTPGSTSVTAAVGAHFDTFQPTQFQLGLQVLNTVSVGRGSKLSYGFARGIACGTHPERLLHNRADQPAHSDAAWRGPRKHRSKSRAECSEPPTERIQILTSSGTLTLDYPDLLTGLSEAFRPDLTSSALIDIQGDVQSIRGSSATGTVINDNGNLNLVKFASVSNSTIVGQPVSHLQIKNRSHVTVLTPSRTAGGRNAVTVDANLNPIGPLSQTND